jgi:hypothetical protein
MPSTLKKAQGELNAPPQVKEYPFDEFAGAANSRAEVFICEALELSILLFILLEKARTDMPHMKWDPA